MIPGASGSRDHLASTSTKQATTRAMPAARPTVRSVWCGFVGRPVEEAVAAVIYTSLRRMATDARSIRNTTTNSTMMTVERFP